MRINAIKNILESSKKPRTNCICRIITFAFRQMPDMKLSTKETDSITSDLNLLHDSYTSKYKSDLLADLEFLTESKELSNCLPPALIGNMELFFSANQHRSSFQLIINYSVLDELDDKKYSQIISQIEPRLKVINSFLENTIQPSNTNKNLWKEAYGINSVIIKAFIKRFDIDNGLIDIQFESVRLNLCGYAPVPVKEPIYFNNDESERASKILHILNDYY